MQRLVYILLATLAAALLWSCNKAPRGVINEDDMEDLMVDLYKAEAYVKLRPDEFRDDSMLMLLKQSIFKEHGVTQELYDTSLVWYAHNMDIYNKVYDNVLDRLKKEQDDIDLLDTDQKPSTVAKSTKKQTDQFADSANLWELPRDWQLWGSWSDGFVCFSIEPDQNYKAGDRYTLSCHTAMTSGTTMALMIAADYNDGSTTVQTLPKLGNGVQTIALQTDTARTVRRVYGYFHYDVPPKETAIINDINLTRTHYDAREFGTIMRQSTYSRAKHDGITANPKAPRSFKPKEGVNKSSHSIHVNVTPDKIKRPTPHR